MLELARFLLIVRSMTALVPGLAALAPTAMLKAALLAAVPAAVPQALFTTATLIVLCAFMAWYVTRR
jgi:hypothetical protein